MTTDPTEFLIPDDAWEAIVEYVPIVSVDLIVRDDDGIILGKRTNEPAKGAWFVPGGTVRKHERLRDAVHRIAREELGTDIEIERRLGTYQHFYDTADVPDVDGKHYLATAFVVHSKGQQTIDPDDQHSEIRTFRPPFPELHPYVERYLADLNLLGREPRPLDHESYR